jgi:AraC-like DNA-binding protein
MLTAKSSVESRIEGLKIGADSYISKPFHPEHLSTRVEKLTEQRELFKLRYSKKILIENNEEKPANQTSPDELFVQKAINFVLSRIDETDLNGDLLASELNISRMGLHRKIKALTNQSTGEFIRNIRLKKAHELLATTAKSVSEICYEVGFNSPSYFTTCFTEVYKITPSEFVKSLKP